VVFELRTAHTICYWEYVLLRVARPSALGVKVLALEGSIFLRQERLAVTKLPGDRRTGDEGAAIAIALLNAVSAYAVCRLCSMQYAVGGLPDPR
jgi:hypothetical protein